MIEPAEPDLPVAVAAGTPSGPAVSPAAFAAGWQAAERAARESYGRLVALLAYRWRDLVAAEDALSDAFAAALQAWPRDGVPAAPEAWLMTAARRRLLQAARHARVERDPRVTALLEEEPVVPNVPALPDERLKLLFVCAHPALPEALHAPLMLQAVLGLDARAIAEAFLVSPAAMAQRLVRAKAKIRDAELRFEEPEARELPARLSAVLDSIYGAYTIASNTARQGSDVAQPAALSCLSRRSEVAHDIAQRSRFDSEADPLARSEHASQPLTGEALFLSRLVVSLQPRSAEAHGLLALVLYCEARRPAQFDADGRFVALTAQDCSRWRRDLLGEAEAALRTASGLRQPGPFQLEAAIQSAHCQRAFTGRTPWQTIAMLYGVLVHHHPGVGAAVGHAVALAEAGRLDDGLAALNGLPSASTANYQPYWVALAHLERLAGRGTAADAALHRAMGLTEDPRVRRHLALQLSPVPQHDGGGPASSHTRVMRSRQHRRR